MRTATWRLRHRALRRRDHRSPRAHVERRCGDLALPSGIHDGLLLPQRRARRVRVRARGLGDAGDDVRQPVVPRGRLRDDPARHDLPFRSRGRAATRRVRVARAHHDPAALPQRVRAAARGRAVLEPRHPSADRAPDDPRAGRVRGQGARPRRLPDVRARHHPFDVVGWDGYLFPWTFSVHDFEPITGRIHQPPPAHQTFQGQNFVICSFCPRKLDFDPEAVRPVPPLEPRVRGDDLLRPATSARARGSRSARSRSTLGRAARAAAGPRGEVARLAETTSWR